MNKLQYQKLLELRSSQEKMLRLLVEFGITPRTIVNTLGINHKRIWYLLDKMQDYDYGVSLDLGWFYPKKYADDVIDKEIPSILAWFGGGL